MTFNEVILGSSPFTFAPQFGHRTRLYELDFKDQPDNIAEIMDKAYELGVNEFLLKSSDDVEKALDLSLSRGNDWSVIGMTNTDDYDSDMALFEKYNTTMVMLDGFFVDKCIEDEDFDLVSKYLCDIRSRDYVPSIETRIPFKHLPIIEESSFLDDFDVIMFPLNFYGYMMDCNFLNKDNKNKIKDIMGRLDKKIIANRTLATGILKPNEAYDFIKNIDYLDAVCVGLAKVSEAEETLNVINSIKS